MGLRPMPWGVYAGLVAPALTDAGAPPCTPGIYAELGAPAPPDAGAPREHGKAMLGTQGDFPDAGKVTKGAPRAAPFGIPRCREAALFALAYASRRATSYH